MGQQGNPDVKKIAQLEEWAKTKVTNLRKKVDEQEAIIADLSNTMGDAMNELLSKLKRADTNDPLCDEFVAELNAMFDNMDLEDGVKPSTSNVDSVEGDPSLCASTVALQHVQSLPDGPQKLLLWLFWKLLW